MSVGSTGCPLEDRTLTYNGFSFTNCDLDGELSH